MSDFDSKVQERIKIWSKNLDAPKLEVNDPKKVIRDPEWFQQKLKPLKEKNDITAKERDTMRKNLLGKYKKLTKGDALLPSQYVDEIEKNVFKNVNSFIDYESEMRKIVGSLLFQLKFVDFQIEK